ncbi:MAG: hypothetical protein WKG07_04800 [Hymenobacter sp.]
MPRIEAVTAGAEDALWRAADAARATTCRTTCCCGAMQPYLFHASLLSELNKLVEQISRERNVVLISEFNRRIAGHRAHRAGAVYCTSGWAKNTEHLLIDEFQDTSVLQWNNLLPLVENALANGGLSAWPWAMPSRPFTAGAAARWSRFCGCYQGNTGALAARARDADMRELLRERY